MHRHVIGDKDDLCDDNGDNGSNYILYDSNGEIWYMHELEIINDSGYFMIFWL